MAYVRGRARTALGDGVRFGVVVGLFRLFTVEGGPEPDDIPLAVIFGLVGGVVVGLLTFWMYPREDAKLWAKVGKGEAASWTADDRRAAVAASLQGDIPTDPRVRRMALAVLEYQVAGLDRWHSETRGAMAIGVIIAVIYALTSTPWAWGVVVVMVGAIGWTIRREQLQRNRLSLFRGNAAVGTAA